MKAAVIVVFILSLVVGLVSAQLDEVAVDQVFAVAAPPGYVVTYSYPRWSPDGTLIAVNFDIVNEQNIPVERLWQIYDVTTGDLLHELVFTGDDLASAGETQFIWYAASTRLLIRVSVDAPTHIVDARTGAILATLENEGPYFMGGSIRNMIVNLDEAHTLRMYDAQSGEIRFTSVNVSGFPIYSPDKTKFAITVADSGVEVYDTASFTLLERLDNFQVGDEYQGNWSPDGTQLVVVPFYSTHRWLGPRHLWTLGEGLSAPIYNLTSAIVWSPDLAQVGAASDYDKVRIYDAYTGELVSTIRGLGEGPIWYFSWNERFLVASSGSRFNNTPFPTLNAWDFQRGEVVLSVETDMASYMLDDEIIEIYDPWIGIRRIDLTTGETIFEQDMDGPIYASPDGQWHLKDDTHFEEGKPVSIYVYDNETFTLLATLSGHTEIVNLYWSPDSQHFASVGGPDIVIVWEVRHSN